MGARSSGRDNAGRDNRIDVVRGAALWMIFVDHVPRNVLGWVTLHVWGFADAAEFFVLLAGVSSMLAYGRMMARGGLLAGLPKVLQRVGRIYLFQAGLFLITVGIVYAWMRAKHTESVLLAPLFSAPAEGVFYGLTLRALPSYLDILPLYVMLLLLFPVTFLLLRRGVTFALGVSGAVWLLANLDHALDLPNWMDGKGWYFNPFAWQFLFTIGAALSVVLARQPDRLLPRRGWAVALAWVYLIGAFVVSAPWVHWGLPAWRLIAMDTPEKSVLAWPRILDILALVYLLFSSAGFQRLVQRGWGETLAVCGRHSLEVFSATCVVALLARLALRSDGDGPAMQVAINLAGPVVAIVLAKWLDRRKSATRVAQVGQWQPS